MMTFQQEARNVREYITALAIDADEMEALLHQVDRLIESITTVKQHGIEVVVTDNANAESDAVLILIDTPGLGKRNMRIRMNDALLYEGNPENRDQVVDHNEFDGYIIRQEH